MKKKTWPIGADAECQDCDWRYNSHINGQAVAANHAKHHNHFVRVETTLVSYYNYPEGTFRKSTPKANKNE